jgi:hypothetical protein
MSHLRIVKPTTPEQKATGTAMDTIIVTPELARQWKKPPFQRDLKVNKRVEEVVEEIKTGNPPIIPGLFTVGILKSDLKTHYLVDGQHRREAFYMSKVEEAFVDVRYLYVDSMGELADEFKKLNGHLVNMSSDDILRAAEESNAELRRLHKACPWIGYTNIRRGPTTPVVSMSCVLRCWFGSGPEVPAIGGMSASTVADNLSLEETSTLIQFQELAFKAWGKDPQAHRLWGNLNMAICMWLYRRLVITGYSAATKKIGNDLFLKCLMSLSADEEYCAWLLGRQLRDDHRAPTYQRIKAHFTKRIEFETGSKPKLPAPTWGGR